MAESLSIGLFGNDDISDNSVYPHQSHSPPVVGTIADTPKIGRNPAISGRKLIYHPTLTPGYEEELRTPQDTSRIRKRNEITPDSAEREREEGFSKRGKHSTVMADYQEGVNDHDLQEEHQRDTRPVTMGCMRMFMNEFRDEQRIQYRELCGKVDNISLGLKEQVKEAVEGAMSEKLPEIEAIVDTKVEKAKGEMRDELEAGFKAMSSQLNRFEDENRRREEREQNVMIGGMDEPAEVDPVKIKEADIRAVTKLVELINRRDVLIIKTARRLGVKRNDDNRLLKFVLANRNQRDIFLHEIRRLKRERKGWTKEAGGLDHITFSVDRSKEEREAYNRLKEEMERRKTNGEKDLAIIRNRIVKVPQPFRGAPR